jgi:hypothetical protein
MHQRWLREPLVAALMLLLLCGCAGESGGGGQQEEQASEDALDAALEKSFEESGAPGVVAAVQTPEYTWLGTLGVADLA